MTATLTSTPARPKTFLHSNSHDSAKHDVSTQLKFPPSCAEKLKIIDFTRPEGAKEYDDYEKADVTHDVVIHDVRGEEQNYTLDRNGFQYVKHEVEQLKGCATEEQIKEVLLLATEELVKQVTGASNITTFQHRIRSLTQDERRGADNNAPAHRAHSDFTKNGAVHHFERTIKDPAERRRLLNSGVMLINVWRPLKTITKDPLAVCDWSTVDVKADLEGYRMIVPNDWHELGKINYSKKQKWCYLSGQRPDEPLVFTQWDSRNEDGFTLPHSAFVHPEFVDHDPRESIEIKMFVFLHN